MEKYNSEINNTVLLAYLDNTLPIDQRNVVEKWIDLNSENKIKFNTLKQLNKTVFIAKDFDKLNPEKSWEDVERRIKKKTVTKYSSNNYAMLLKIAAVLIICMSLSALFFKTNTTTLIAETTKEYELPDGTQVWLKKGSTLRYGSKFNGQERRVEMEGEAYFKVAKNKDKPFKVTLNNTITEVLGTQFNLKYQPEHRTTSLVLVEGSVKFANDKTTKVVKPGETITANPLGVLAITNTDDKNFNSWITKELQFDNTSLSDVIKAIANTYSKPIIIENKNLELCRLTTTFTNQSLSQVLETLKILYQFNIIEEDNQIVLRNGMCP